MLSIINSVQLRGAIFYLLRIIRENNKAVYNAVLILHIKKRTSPSFSTAGEIK